MTLVEMMVVSGIMMVIALAFATMMKNQTDQQNAIRERSERTNMETATRGSASNTTAVQRSLMVVDP